MTPKPKYTNRRIATVGVVLLVLLPILWIAFTYQGMIERRIPGWVAKATDSTYTISMSDFHMRLFTGAVHITDLRLFPDSTRITPSGEGSNASYVISVDTLQMTGIKWWQLLVRKKFTSRKVILLNPSFVIHTGMDTLKMEDTVRVEARNLPVQIGQLQMRNASLLHVNSQDDSLSIKTHSGTLNWNDLVVNSQPDDDSIARVRFREFSSDSLVIVQSDGYYMFRTGAIAFSSDQRSCTIEALSLELAISMEEFYRRVGQQTDCFEMQIPLVTIHGLDNDALFARKGFIAKEMTIADGKLSLLMNRVLPPTTQSKMGNFPNQLLLRASMPIHVDTIHVENGHVHYTEIGNTTRMEGNVTFEKINGRLTNVTNMPLRIAENHTCTIALTANAFGVSPVAGTFSFNLDDDSGGFHLNGYQKTMDLTQMNSTLSALALMELESGQLDGVRVEITGNQHGATADLELRYQDFQLRVLKMDDNVLETKGVLTFLANQLFTYPANPMPGDAVRTVQPRAERDQYKSFFNLIWKCLFYGSLETILRNEKINEQLAAKPAKEEKKRRRKRE